MNIFTLGVLVLLILDVLGLIFFFSVTHSKKRIRPTEDELF